MITLDENRNVLGNNLVNFSIAKTQTSGNVRYYKEAHNVFPSRQINFRPFFVIQTTYVIIEMKYAMGGNFNELRDFIPVIIFLPVMFLYLSIRVTF